MCSGMLPEGSFLAAAASGHPPVVDLCPPHLQPGLLMHTVAFSSASSVSGQITVYKIALDYTAA